MTSLQVIKYAPLNLTSLPGKSLKYFFAGTFYLNLTGVATHNVELGESATGNLTRIENVVEGIPKRLDEAREKLGTLHDQVRATEEELGKEFPHALELREKNARLAKLNAELSMRDDRGEHNVSEQVDFGKMNDRERVEFALCLVHDAVLKVMGLQVETIFPASISCIRFDL